jgi:NAD-dependent deacetylase
MRIALDLSRYRHVVVLTGAGVSKASGLPTYRGEGGLWTQGDTARNSDGATLAADPEAVLRFFLPWRAQIAAAAPNPAHTALAAAEARRPDGTTFTVITQNIDRLHQRAGSRDVIEIHGSLFRSRCTRCDAPAFEDRRAGVDPLPRCERCDALLRPDVTLFGEVPPARAEHDSKRALRTCDLFVAIGTSAKVWPAAGFVRGAAYAGARCVYINLDPLEDASGFGESYLGKAEELVPELFA